MLKIVTSLLLAALALPLAAQDSLSPALRASIDKAASDILARTGAPSASIAVVKDGRLAYAHAYGIANVDTKAPATTQMRYSIGSISKQFTAAAVLLLAEEGKLSLDDKVVRWLPELTRAGNVTIRQLLSMTSGYQDFWPQDYVMPGMLQPASAQDIMTGWGKKPLDFEPGTKWQYSNTNYVIAGAIVERVAGMPLIDLLKRRVFEPLHMSTVFDTDLAPLGPGEPQRYLRYGLGPVRPAPKEGKGWMFAAGELAMTPSDLAKWDISIIDQTILQPASYREMEKEVALASGIGSRYGLGLTLGMVDGRRLLSHGGEVSGFTAENDVYPDDRVSVSVLTNIDAASAASQLATKIGTILFAPSGTEGAQEQAKKIFTGLQEGTIDRTLFTSNANAYFSDAARKDFAATLKPLGMPTEFTQTRQGLRGGMTSRSFKVVFPKKTLRVWTFAMPDGKLEQYMVAPAE